MKMISGLERRRYMAIVSVFLITIYLIVGVAGCGNGGDGDGDYRCDLNVASTVGGSVVQPGEGEFDYAANTTVDLVAEADEHYHFANWTGDVATVGNVTSAATNITLYSDCSITANFELDPGCYSLTISGEGGSVITPGEGVFAYVANTTVDLVAEPDEGYPFLKWAGDADTIASVETAATNITMRDSYSITAHFGIQVWDWYALDGIHDDLGSRYYLMTDIDSTTPGYVELAGPTSNDGKGWEPLGVLKDHPLNDTPFNGTFDGQGYEIRDLFIHRPDEGHIGFFGAVNGAIIRDIGLVNVNITGYADVGALAGDFDRAIVNARGFISDCYSSGIVTGEYYGIGGLVGASSVPVSNSHSTATVTGNTSVAGLLGVSTKAVNNCYFSGIVAGYQHVGGLVGENYDSISDCYSIATVTGYMTVGGIVGGSKGGVYGCYSMGSVTGNVNIGGIMGCGEGVVRNSHSASNVDGERYVGGLRGCCRNNGSVSDSYCTGSVNGDEYVGGLVGFCDDSGSVNNSYSTGSVIGSSYVGGLVGYSENESNVVNCFWDTQTSGQTTSDGGTGKTTAQMKNIATFSGVAWDIIAVANPNTRNPSYIWNIVDAVTYPFLSWEP